MLSSGVLFTMLFLQGMAFLLERAFGLAQPNSSSVSRQDAGQAKWKGVKLCKDATVPWVEEQCRAPPRLHTISWLSDLMTTTLVLLSLGRPCKGHSAAARLSPGGP